MCGGVERSEGLRYAGDGLVGGSGLSMVRLLPRLMTRQHGACASLAAAATSTGNGTERLRLLLGPVMIVGCGL